MNTIVVHQECCCKYVVTLPIDKILRIHQVLNSRTEEMEIKTNCKNRKAAGSRQWL